MLQGKSNEPSSETPPVGTSEEWVALDSGKSFAWSTKQHGSLSQQIEAMQKLIQQQGQQVCNTLLVHSLGFSIVAISIKLCTWLVSTQRGS